MFRFYCGTEFGCSESGRWAAPIIFVPRTLWRTWGTRRFPQNADGAQAYSARSVRADRRICFRLSGPLFAVLPGGSLGSVDGEAQLTLRGVEVLLSFGAVAHHVVMIGRTGMIHLMDGFNDMLVNIVKI